MNLDVFLSELKRRRVYRVAIVYVIVGLGVLGAAEVILDPLGLGALRAYIVILVLLGFPIALVLAWAYELRPEEPRGAERTAGAIVETPEAVGDLQRYEIAYVAPAHLRRAQIHERLGEPEEAAEHYVRFVELWHECDPELRPLVEEAGRRLEALAESPATP